MFASFSRSWELVKQSFNVLKSDRELLLFPFISMIGVFLVTLVFSIPLFFSGILNNLSDGNGSNGNTALGVILLFAFYFVTYTVIIYSNVALVGAAMIRLRGGNPTLSDGIKVANSRISKIVSYAAISATVGVLLSMLRDNDSIIGRILAGIINFAWSVVTFLVVPVLVMEDIGPIDAIKRSGALLKKTWGEPGIRPDHSGSGAGNRRPAPVAGHRDRIVRAHCRSHSGNNRDCRANRRL